MPPQRHPCKTTLTEQVRLEMLARHRLLNKQVHVPTVAHLNAAAVSNTAIAPSSSLLPPLSSRRSAGARRVATAARARCSRRRRRRAATAAVSLLPPRLGCAAAGNSHTCALRKLPCVRAFISRELNSVFPVADCQSCAFGHSKPAGAIHITRASENPDIDRRK